MPRFTHGQYSDVTAWFASGGGIVNTSSTLYVAPLAVNNPLASTYYWTYFAQPAAFTGTGVTIPNAYTLYIAGAPQAGTSTITNAYALYIAAGKTLLADTSASSSTTTGALVISGGVGIAGNLYVGGTINGTVSGTISTSSVQVTSNGTVGAPAYSWQADTSTGFYRIGASEVGLSLGGTKYVDWAIASSTYNNTLILSQLGNSTASSATVYVNPASTTFSGTSNYYFSYFNTPTTTGLTSGTASTVAIAGPPTKASINYALNVLSGNSYFGSNVIVNGTTGFTFTAAPYIIAGGAGGNTLAYSTNGTSWTGIGATIFSTQCQNIAYNGSMWVAVGTGTNTIAYSTNGTSWTGLGNIIFTSYGWGVAWNGSMWVAVGDSDGTHNAIAYSYDGINWVGVTLNTIFSVNGYQVAWNGTLWVAVGSGTNSIAYSYDGINWVGLGTTLFSQGIVVASNSTMWLIGGYNGTGNNIAYSYDGINWTLESGITGISNSCYALAWNGSMWAAGGIGTNTLAYSTNGITWTGVSAHTIFTLVSCLCWTGSQWIAVGQGNNTIAYSPDAINWNGEGNIIFSPNSAGVTAGYSQVSVSNSVTNGNMALANNLIMSGASSVLSVSGSTLSLNTTSGSIVSLGGLGIKKNIWYGGAITNSLSSSLNGILMNMATLTYTDSASAGTIANVAFNSIQQPTLASTNARTTTNAITQYLAGAPIKGTNETFTNAYGLYIDSATTTSATVTQAASLYIANAPTVTSGTTYALNVAAGSSIFNGSIIVAGGATASGSGAIDFSGNSGTFKTTTGAITIGGNTSTITIGSGATPSTNIIVASGTTGNIDFSNSSGLFKTTTGAVTIGSGAVGITGQTTFSQVGNSTISSATIYVNPSSTTFSGSNNYYFTYLATPTSTGSTTGTASTLTIAGAPANATTAYALNVAAGASLLGGPAYYNVQTPITANTTINYTSNQGSTVIIPLNPTGTITITLPSITANPSNEMYFVHIATAGTTIISVANPATEVFDNGSTTLTLSTQYDRVRLTSLYNASSPTVKVWLSG